MKEFEIRDLSSEQKSFLNDYCPEDKHFTSKDEIKKIDEILNLGSLSEKDLRATRNAVVDYYDEQMNDEFDCYHTKTEKFYSLNLAMMSVTSVIDYFLLNEGWQI